MRIQPRADSSCRPAEYGKSQEDSGENIQEGQPEQAQTEKSGRTAKTNDRRGTDKSAAVGQRHKHGVNFPTADQIVRGALGLLIPQPSEITDYQGVNTD